MKQNELLYKLNCEEYLIIKDRIDIFGYKLLKLNDQEQNFDHLYNFYELIYQNKNKRFIAIREDYYSFMIAPLSLNNDLLNFEKASKHKVGESEIKAMSSANSMIFAFISDYYPFLKSRSYDISDNINYNYKIQKRESNLLYNINAQVYLESKFDVLEDQETKFICFPYHIFQNDPLKVFYSYRYVIEHTKKKVKCLIYVNRFNKIRIYLGSYQDKYRLNSFIIESSAEYQVVQSLKQMMNEALNSTIPEDISGIPFPQANDITKLLEIALYVYKNKIITENLVTINYQFNKRQTSYYLNALCYFDIIVSKGKEYRGSAGLEELFYNNELVNLNTLLKLFASRPIFNDVMLFRVINNRLPSSAEIVTMFDYYDINGVDSRSTKKRRASTLISWFRWLEDYDT